MRWLFIKDLQILKRSPLLVALLAIYPVAIALMIGFALSSPPGKPKVAFYSEVPAGKGKIGFGNQQINVSNYAKELFQSIQPIKVNSRAQAIAKVENGDALAALVIPSDIAQPDPEPDHHRRRQPDGRRLPQYQGSARAPVRRPGDHLAAQRGRAIGVEAGAPRRRRGLGQGPERGHDPVPRPEHPAARDAQLPRDHRGEHRLAAAPLPGTRGPAPGRRVLRSGDRGAWIREPRARVDRQSADRQRHPARRARRRRPTPTRSRSR